MPKPKVIAHHHSAFPYVWTGCDFRSCPYVWTGHDFLPCPYVWTGYDFRPCPYVWTGYDFRSCPYVWTGYGLYTLVSDMSTRHPSRELHWWIKYPPTPLITKQRTRTKPPRPLGGFSFPCQISKSPVSSQTGEVFWEIKNVDF